MLAVLFLLAGCDVYNQALLDGALGDAGEPGVGGTSGSVSGGGTGGSFGGGGGLPMGGTSGAGAAGGTVSTGGSQGGGGSSGEGGEGDQGSGGTSGGGQGGSSMGGTAGASGDSGTAGQGGMPGGTGGSGDAGGGMAGGGAGNAGTGGDGAGSGGGGAGSGGAGEVCTGCARLSVPLAALTDQAHFTIALPAATDFSAATIAFRVARLAGTGGWFKGYIQEGSPNYLYQDSVETTIASIGTSMQTISWDVATAGTTADKTIIRRIGIEISGNGASSWTSPTVLYVDSVTVTGTTLAMASFTFDTQATVSTTPTGSGPNNVIWLNNFSGDTNVTGAALSWLGP